MELQQGNTSATVLLGHFFKQKNEEKIGHFFSEKKEEKLGFSSFQSHFFYHNATKVDNDTIELFSSLSLSA